MCLQSRALVSVAKVVRHGSFVAPFFSDASFEECLNWSVDDVGDWLRSLDPIFTTYIVACKTNPIDGYHLLTSSHDVIHSQLGIVNQQHKIRLVQAIDVLRSSTGKDFYDRFQRDAFIIPYRIREMEKRDAQFCQQIMVEQIRRWLAPASNYLAINQVELLHDHRRYRTFIQQIMIAGYERRKRELLRPISTVSYQKKKILDRLQKLSAMVDRQQSKEICIVRGWYWCPSIDIFNNLLRGGTSITLKASAAFASDMQRHGGCLVMCYLVLHDPYAVVIRDEVYYRSSNRYRFYNERPPWYNGTESETVIPLESGKLEKTHVPVCDIDLGWYDEFVTFRKDAVLPQAVIQLRVNADSSV